MRLTESLSLKGIRKAGFLVSNSRTPDWAGQLQLLVMQPSPFCNLDCDYCYLPDRQNSRRMEFSTLETAAKKIFSAGLPAPDLSVIWHAGEPLAVPRDWYSKAFEILAGNCPPSVRLTHHFQTNGVLIDANWVSFFREHGIRVGVSLDGPAWLHDRHRRTRDFRGTHARVMRGIGVLKKFDVPFHTICVLTRESLDHPDELFDFFAGLNPLQLCFNVEEIEAANTRSSLAVQPLETERAFRSFMAQIVKRAKSAGYGKPTDAETLSGNNSFAATSYPRIRIREIDDVLNALRRPGFGAATGNSQNIPGQILSIAWDGRFSTFSPELLGQAAPGLGELALGNVISDTLPPGNDAAGYRRQWEAIRTGIERCRATCAYFDLCQGGVPANKLGETGRFDSTETLFCRLTKKAVIDVVLDELDRDLPNNRCQSAVVKTAGFRNGGLDDADQNPMPDVDGAAGKTLAGIKRSA